MLFKRIYDDDLAHASYLIGCQACGVAAVIDPRRDIDIYLEEAQKNQLELTLVAETHIHADYLSGARELAAATRAALYLSDEGGEEWQYRFPHNALRHDDEIRVGNIILKALHTPGHTPEHLMFLVTDGATASEPGFALTGDFVFVGDLGRPDLLDETAEGKDTRVPMARQLYRSLKEQFMTLPDYVQIWPGHGAGSACGRALGAVMSTTVGYETRFAWWSPYLKNNDEEGFVQALLEGQPDAPKYFGRMKRQNRAGPALLAERTPLLHYLGEELVQGLEQGARLIDTRARETYQKDAVQDSLHIPAGKNFATWAAWVIDPEKNPSPLIVLAQTPEQATLFRDKLARVGIDNIIGYTTDLNGLPRAPIPTVSPEQVKALEHPFILDVRAKSEHEEGHIPEATHLHGGRVLWHQDELPHDQPIVIHCQTGARSAVVASALRAEGFGPVLELERGFEGWQDGGREVEKG